MISIFFNKIKAKGSTHHATKRIFCNFKNQKSKLRKNQISKLRKNMIMEKDNNTKTYLRTKDA